MKVVIESVSFKEDKVLSWASFSLLLGTGPYRKKVPVSVVKSLESILSWYYRENKSTFFRVVADPLESSLQMVYEGTYSEPYFKSLLIKSLEAYFKNPCFPVNDKLGTQLYWNSLQSK